MPTPNASYDSEVLATTIDNHRKEFVDAVSTSSLFWKTMMPKKKPWVGGLNMTKGVHYRLNDTAGFYGEWDTLDATAQNNMTRAVYAKRHAVVNISISGQEEDANQSDSQIGNLLEEKITNAKLAMTQEFNQALFGAGGGDAFDGLSAIVSTTDPAAGAYGGIARSGNTYWQGSVNSTGGVMSFDMMRNKYTDVTRGQIDRPDLIITTAALWDKFESLHTPGIQFAGGGGEADMSFDVLKFRNAKVVYDEDCPPGTVYFLNTKYLELYFSPDNFMKMTKFSERGDNNLDARSAFMFTYGNLICTNPKFQGKITSVTA